ncbi:BTAD domain-containing putative transcriptional regulator [Solirubrobacter deserti]|uniref:SARP family transcriptional regulator n=1 Tax=Solirubrobacter deserti TaxID=2282478 RepID=A0ABT4RD74_9ACTN|nr:BTAD domain-containing putative transcriptional regulator [Solirubrobacter deserti]MDA0136478.1 SARP family transcriptional regulator [Solirubrobacter deserti]
MEFGVLGPVVAWDEAGSRVALRGPRHRAVLARLIVARGAVVPLERLVDDLWPVAPPPRAVGSVRTFVSDLRRALGPARGLVVTEGPGYALRTAGPGGAPASGAATSAGGATDAAATDAAATDAGVVAFGVDAWRFEAAVEAAATLASEARLGRLLEALGWWRGPAFADLDDQDWALGERRRLAELRLHAVEAVADARVRIGRAAEAVADLDAHVAAHPWREEGWRLLALALASGGRRGDALEVLRRAHVQLGEQLGIEPGEPLRALQRDLLHGADAPASGVDAVWARAAAAYDREVGARARVRLESTVGLLRGLAVTGGGGLTEARTHRLAAIAAAEELDDPLLTARVIGAYDVPAIWTRSDDPEHAATIVAAARRALDADLPDASRAPLLATIALESRGAGTRAAADAAREAERLARELDDPALLAFALNGVWMQSFERCGLAPRRDAIGAELVALATRHELASVEVLGHLIRMQARGALGDFAGADGHAAAADRLDARHERPLVAVFTSLYRAMRTGDYRDAAALLPDAGMPGVERGLLALATWNLDGDFGPYGPWARPHVLLARGERGRAAAAVRALPDPPADLLLEALWCLTAKAAAAVGDEHTLRRARAHLEPARDEHAAGSGVLTLGPVADYLD